jgi:hypothetical protein
MAIPRAITTQEIAYSFLKMLVKGGFGVKKRSKRVDIQNKDTKNQKNLIPTILEICTSFSWQE